MEDSAMKAIVISVSVFVAIITISAVIIYYNTAKDIVNVTGTGVDLAVAQQQDIENILLKANNNAKVSGTEVMNIIKYFYNNKKYTVSIILKDIVYLNGKYSVVKNENKEYMNANLDEYEYQEAMKNILPVFSFTLEEDNNNLIFTQKY